MSLVGIFVWLVDNIGARILLSLGMGFVSYASVSVAANALIGQFTTLWSGIPSAMLSLITLAGFPTAIGWIIGAYLARLSLNSLTRISKLPV